MRFAIVLALVGACLAARGIDRSGKLDNYEKNVQERSFRSGREFRYVFNGQLSAGLPVPGTAQGMTRIQTLVTLQTVSDNVVRMQLSDFLYANSQELTQPRNMQPIDKFEKVRMEKEHEETISLPLEFNYRHGIVSDIKFTDDDQAWSENIKRAVLNMLQVNILKQERVDAEKYERSESSEENTNTFVAVERMLEGECEVLYTQEVSEESKRDEQRWTKSVNYEKCQNRPVIRHTQVPVCQDCKPTLDENKMSSTVLSFNITGTPENFLIDSVEIRSQHMFAPLNEQQQLLGSFVHNTLELVYAGEKKQTIEKIRGDRTQDMIYNNEWEIAEQMWAQTGEEKYLRQLPQWGSKVEMIQKMFTLMGKQLEKNVEPETAHMVARIVKILRVSNEEELTKIYRHISHSDEKIGEQLRSIYYNCLGLAGTRVTVHNLVEKIQERKVSPAKAAVALKSLVDTRYPSIQMADELVRLCESDIASSSPVLRQSCWLTYGALVNGFCGQTPRVYAQQNLKKMCPRETKDKIINQLVERFESATTRYEKTLVLKTIANAGVDVSVFALEKIINNDKEEKTVRVQAIEALRKLRSNMPRKVQQILLPVYKNRQQPQQIRMSALHQIFYTQPEWTVLSQIGQQLRQERSQQVRAFTLSLLRSFARNESPCEKTFSARVNRLLQTISFSDRQIDTLESRFGKWSAYSRDQQTGFESNFGAIFTNESVLPNDVMTSLEGVFAGEWNQYFAQMGISHQNVDKVLRNLITKVQENGLEQIVVRGKRSTGSFRPTELLNSLLNKLRIVRRQQNPEQPHALLYVRFRDMDYAFVPLDVESIPEMIKNMIQGGRIEIGEIERILAEGVHFSTSGAAFVYESIRRIPTALGLPVQLTSKMPTVATFNGHLKFEIEPKNGKSFDGLRLNFNVQPKIASTHVTSLTVMSPIAQSGTKLLHQLIIDTPVEAKIEMNWQNKFVMKTLFKAPREERRLVSFHSRPVTFTRQSVSQAHQYPEPVEMTLVVPNARQFVSNTFDRKYLEKTGVRVNVVGSIARQVTPTEPRMQFPAWIAENTIEVSIEPTQDAPKEYETIFEVELYEPVKMEKPDFDRYFEKTHKTSMYLDAEENTDEYMDENEKQDYIKLNLKDSHARTEKAYKHRISFEARAVGQKQRLVAGWVEAKCNDKMDYCKTEIEARRLPIDEESREWELKSTIQHLLPKTPKSVEEMKEQKYRNMVVLGEFTWGAEKKQQMTVKIEGQQSAEQKIWWRQIEKNQKAYGLNEREILEEAARLNQYQVAVDFEMEKTTQKMFNRFWTIVQSRIQNPWEARVESRENVQEGNVRAQLTIEPKSRQMFNLTVATPFEKESFERVEMPFALPSVQIHHSPKRTERKEEPSRNILEKVARHVSKNAECVVKSSKVETFDKVVYRTPMTPCYSVLAKDCASEKPRFVVLMKKDGKSEESKNMKVLIGDDEVEMWMTEERRVVVRVNGEEKEYEKETEELIEKQFNIMWLSEKLVKIVSDDLEVQFDGKTARIHLSAVYRNQQCGLCGHYDNEKETEFYGADNEEKENIQDFARSFVYDDDKCDFDETVYADKKNFGRVEEEERSEETLERSERLRQYKIEKEQGEWNDEQKPSKQTLVVERSHEICFSNEQKPRCDEQTESTENRKEKVEFTCVSNSNSYARRMIREVRRQPLSDNQLNKIQEQPKAQKRTLSVKVDEKCQPRQSYNL